ncbi:MAG: hypothetical protein KAT70_08035 [Thermoplasmata archaeon]|nr:hypothetical protein [Thermoplasmata archaeon]
MGAVGKEYGADSQRMANNIANEVGRQLGKELVYRGMIKDNMETDEILDIALKELDVAGQYRTKTTTKAKVYEIKDCNICPKKIGKYPLPATACPLPGIVRGLLQETGRHFDETYPDLKPGEVCNIKLKLS